MAIWLSTGPLDRRAEIRTLPDSFETYLAHPEARVVPVVGTKSLVVNDGDLIRASLIERRQVSWSSSEWVFLGMRDETPLFAAEVPPESDSLTLPGDFQDLRRVGPALSKDDAAILGYARAMIYWHQKHRFCGVCGHPTEPREAGHKRVCTNEDCRTEHFPRTDAAMIVVVHDGADRCLLARSPRFPPHMFSALAGFLEPGESLEDCVVREVFEEVGLRVTDVCYHSSQPWPFPRSIMIGFHARAETTDLALDRAEIEEARWVTRDYLQAKNSWKDFFIPPRIAVARHLIDDWVAGRVPSAR
ncbi:MAG: NAD(+) diphosphatase [Myxococcota bacterium]